MDGSTDDSVTKQETIFIGNCVQGKTITRCVCICEPQSTSSEDMFAFVNEKLNENYLTNHTCMSKFVGFGCDGASNMMGCKTGLVTRLQECCPEVEEIENDREVEIESEREIQSNREGERDSEETRDKIDDHVDSDGEIDSESECEQSEDETFRNVNKFVEIEYEMEYH
jgi:hypothetical protein